MLTPAAQQPDVATVVAIPSGFVTLGDVIGRWQHERVFPPEVPVHKVEVAFGASLTIAIIGIRYGRRLVRGTRSPVLFLRRFGYRGSMQVVTSAVANTIGSSWRLVTLDDAAIAPVGVQRPIRRRRKERVDLPHNRSLCHIASELSEGLGAVLDRGRTKPAGMLVATRDRRN